ncbi:hypothetical protein ABML65_004495, partial [Salmonella enterica subsp. enterica serovar Newport]|nr:hypothetical protein [Salmonella enterica subsp. enterica serovar Typhimurium]EBS5920142.1 hypothetical protein [Salmonella enterica subsp. enterica serovar Bispebjerg]EBW6564446.1 hypothetical protein [Salmonella enterica subsp. enterica serovar Newport]EBX1109290.1 hypothetical protein [Salmonella enterica subsp. enterica serovar Salford]ECF6912503.1 hypothetical protein [Salmonella enterica subsp. enterica]
TIQDFHQLLAPFPRLYCVKGRTLTYEFNRMSKVVQDELDKAINEVLNRNLSQ